VYNAKTIIPGLLGFVAVAALPLWLAMAGGGTGDRPELELPQDGSKCVESTEYMRDNHMLLLDDWRDLAVREGKRIHVSSDGTRHKMSLTGTCMSCHTNGEAFCDRCHNYAGVTPTCWDCHVRP